MTGAESDDPRAEDSLRSLVRMAREDFDEEPSPRIDAMLMAAARRHAPAPKVGLFARLRRWLSVSMMSPAVAGATALVVIGGTAGVLYLRDPAKRLAEPTVGGEGRDTAVMTADEAPAPVSPDPAPAIVDGEEVVVGLVDPPPSEPIDLARPAPRRTLPPRREAMTGNNNVALEQQEFAGLKADMRTTETPPPPDLQLAESDSVTATAAGGAGAPADEAEGADRDARDDAANNRAQAENLLRQARTAAKKRNCPPVKVMAQRAKRLDALYYDATFRKDPDVKTCLD